MAHKITYCINEVAKEIQFSYSEFHNMHEAVAAAEGIDISAFLAMEQQLAAVTKDKNALRNFRDTEFAQMGLTQLYFWKHGGE